ncbi:hypothetical protein F4823DRAFT_640626 [Ustulina deusta]|nr:hypothetical protein F4823DRAFT_640626 [Ustulina deusta]
MTGTPARTAAQKGRANPDHVVAASTPASSPRATRHRPHRTQSPTPIISHQQDVVSTAPVQSRSCKRKQSTENELEFNPYLEQKRQRTCRTHASENISGEPAACSDRHKQTDPIAFWTKEGRWPEEHCWPDKISETGSTIENLLARKKTISASSLSLKRTSSVISMTPSDQRSREEKSASYRDARYPLLLQTKGSYMDISELGITDASEHLIRDLLGSEKPVPTGTLFDDDIFVNACRNLQNKNEARIILDISRLIVPSAESLALRIKGLRHLTESVNEGWNNSIPLTGTRPQPDYSVGFKREAFTAEQLTKLSPFLGDFIGGDRSFFMATYYMHFPFLTCEVKCGAAGLDVADRQNAYSMTLAVRAVVELCRAVKRECEVHRKIMGFSISHDQRVVRIYGHYSVIDGRDTKYYCHPIYEFAFTTLDGKEKWTAYRFTKNVYDVWMPAHFKMICSAIDQLPANLDFDVASLPETDLSQDVGGGQRLSQSDADTVLLSIEQDSQSSKTGQEEGTPGTSLADSGAAKRRKNRN